MPKKSCDRRPKSTLRQEIALNISGLDHALEGGGKGVGVRGEEWGGGGSYGCQAFQHIPASAPSGDMEWNPDPFTQRHTWAGTGLPGTGLAACEGSPPSKPSGAQDDRMYHQSRCFVSRHSPSKYRPVSTSRLVLASSSRHGTKGSIWTRSPTPESERWAWHLRPSNSYGMWLGNGTERTRMLQDATLLHNASKC